MDRDEKLRFATHALVSAEGILRKAAAVYPPLEGPGRALRRIAEVANRPLRIGVLGEPNSGKSSLANLFAGFRALPADPVASTTLPALLKYAPAPSVTAIYKNGGKIVLPASQNVAQAIAALGENGSKITPPAGKNVPEGAIKYLEAGIPSDLLRSVEILDFPASQDPAGFGMDAAIWTTVATQAWRESERAQWLKVPEAIRSRGLLAVTYCDMIAGGKHDLKRLQARLEKLAKPHFQGICFVAAGDGDPASAAFKNKLLFLQVQYLTQEFSAERLGKAMAIARRVMKRAIETLGPGAEAAAYSGLALPGGPGAGKDALGENWLKDLRELLAQPGLEKPAILRSVRSAPRPAAQAMPAGVLPSADRPQGRRPFGVALGAVILLAGIVLLGAVQLGIFDTGRMTASNPTPPISKLDEQAARAEAEARRKAAAEAAEAEARRKAAAEAAEAEARRKAAAEAAAAEARRKAVAEAAEAEARRKAAAEAAKAEARRKAAAEAAAAEARRKAAAEAAEAEARRKAAAEAAEAEARRKAAAEAAAAEARRKAAAEAAEAEARRKAAAEAAEAEARRKAAAEAAKAEARRKAAAEARRKAAAEARRKAKAKAAAAARRRRAQAEAQRRRKARPARTPHRSGSSPIMHGVAN